MSAPILDHLAALRARTSRSLLDLCAVERHVHTQRIFSIAIYGWLLLGTLLLLPYYESLWGPASLVNRIEFDPSRWYHWVGYLSLHPTFADHTWMFVTGQLFCLGLGLCAIAPRFAAIGVYFFTMNIYHRTGQLLDGGNNLAALLLFYFVFMNLSGRPLEQGRSALRKLAVAASNAAFYMCRIQVVIVYLCASVLKLNGPLWQKGMALYYILQGETYTHPIAQDFVVAHPGVAMLATYATLIFQVLFFVLIWWRPARPWLVAMGVSLHLFGIGLGMGLLLFGLIMCLAYLAFLPADVAERIRAPWLRTAPLQVVVPIRASRVAALLGAIAWLDPRGGLVVRKSDAVLDVHATDPQIGGETHGIAALWLVLRRVPLLLPLVPLALATWYVGVAQLAHRRWLSAAGAPRATS